MKLLFDQNLSFKLCRRLEDLFPDSSQVRLLGLDQAYDEVIWQYAPGNGFTLVTQDSDFADLSLALGTPPKVIWLRCGNAPTAKIENNPAHTCDRNCGIRGRFLRRLPRALLTR